MSIASVGKSKSKAAKGKAPARGRKAAPAEAKSPDVARILVSRIEADPDQPRRKCDPEGLDLLAGSLKSRGQLQPIRVRWSPDLGKWLIVAGERRLRAARLAGLKWLDCVIAPPEAADREVFVDQLVENCCREDLGPVEEARAFARVIEARSCSAAGVAELVGKSRSSVARSLALLRLPAEVLDRVEAGELPASTALALGKVEDPSERAEALGRALGGELTRDRAFAEARGSAPDPRPSKALPDWRDRPAMGLDLPAYLSALVAESGIETAGELWGLLETGYLVEGFGWTVGQARALESSLVRLRHEAGDPGGFTVLDRVTGRGGVSHGATLRAGDPAPPEGWHRAPLVFGTLPEERILGRVEGLEIVARCKSGPRTSAEVLAALRRAVELAEAEEVEAPDVEAPAPMVTFEVVEKIGQKAPGHIRFQATSQDNADEHCRENWPKLSARPFDPARPVPKARPPRRPGKVRPGVEASP